jgi:ribokinase
MQPNILVVGSANTDFIVQVPQIPVVGETVIGGVFHTAKGGKGANQAVAAARLGGNVTLITRLGTDTLGNEAITAYQIEDINTTYIARDVGSPSGVALILVNSVGENIIAVAPGANYELTPQDIMNAETAIKEADCVLIQLEIPVEAVVAAAQIARRHNVRVILNPAPAGDIPVEVWHNVDVLTPNEKEAADILGEAYAQNRGNLLADLAEKTGVDHIVVTLGDKGATVLSNGRESHVPNFSVTPVDTTACGDAFNGALAVALGQGKSLLEAVKYANAAGALAATKLGAQPSLPTAKEVEAFLASQKLAFIIPGDEGSSRCATGKEKKSNLV